MLKDSEDVLSFKHGNLSIAFTPATDLADIVKSTIEAKNAAGKLVVKVERTGLSTKGLEGEHEMVCMRLFVSPSRSQNTIRERLLFKRRVIHC